MTYYPREAPILPIKDRVKEKRKRRLEVLQGVWKRRTLVFKRIYSKLKKV